MPLQRTALDYVPIIPDSFSKRHKNISDRGFIRTRKLIFWYDFHIGKLSQRNSGKVFTTRQFLVEAPNRYIFTTKPRFYSAY